MFSFHRWLCWFCQLINFSCFRCFSAEQIRWISDQIEKPTLTKHTMTHSGHDSCMNIEHTYSLVEAMAFNAVFVIWSSSFALCRNLSAVHFDATNHFASLIIWLFYLFSSCIYGLVCVCVNQQQCPLDRLCCSVLILMVL